MENGTARQSAFTIKDDVSKLTKRIARRSPAELREGTLSHSDPFARKENYENLYELVAFDLRMFDGNTNVTTDVGLSDEMKPTIRTI